MTKTPLACIILAAGQGKRMKSSLPKVLHPIAGQPMIKWLLQAVSGLDPQKIVVVTAPDAIAVAQAVHPHQTMVQQKPLGTADAVKAAMPMLKDFEGTVLVLYGDGPLYRDGTLRNLVDAMQADSSADLGFLAMRLSDPTGYGRMICDQKGYLQKIVEEKDATADERRIDLCWSGVMCGRKAAMEDYLAKVDNNNAAGEYYLTTLPALALAAGRNTIVAKSPIEETLGANSRAELAVLERKVQDRLRHQAMENGATLTDPASVFFSWDTKTGRDVVIGPHVVFGPGVVIGDSVTIKSFCHIEGTRIESGSVVGPFARLRPGTHLHHDVRIGNFVEVKNAVLHDGVKANHLSYIGDADIGAGTNFSCGAITANYDGYEKHKTIIGPQVMVGSNVTLIAPVTVNEGAYIAAGSTISKDVASHSLAVERNDQRQVDGWAMRKRDRAQKK